ncbi:uncharacterized protein LOC127251769 [Andrographis paniculata]|uniref:uncharacterized protein LOC127251769 n=1 Tax=Andrographis paniculata TaxID=175694 RepID=UPI0021E8120F|nr:uncharacterized protein LOC127251769 [Andrographis paniculata]
MSGSTPSPKFDNLLLHSLMSRLHLRTPPSSISATAAESIEDLLFSDLLLNLHDFDSESENGDSSSTKTPLAREESKLEKEIIHTILSGEIESLKPNSGQAIAIGEHHVCVGFQEETGSDYRVWEWHGHIMLFDDDDGYAPEYIYGNYFERITANSKVELKTSVRKETSDDEEEVESEKLGLKELIKSGESGSGRILHRNLNTNSSSPRYI